MEGGDHTEHSRSTSNNGIISLMAACSLIHDLCFQSDTNKKYENT